ncbi:hypothetical protein L1987_46751 [Smallanthus sonchifolius]|uniref:Uncharacterized protein n=1 Tax=Smallanthus sonchifolius TaxID=185202 RepID=A0ACB9G1P3_9ASTR|nr:hypothetical protein L1987_46751 [Smallanthus sonchifolius]
MGLKELWIGPIETKGTKGWGGMPGGSFKPELPVFSRSFLPHPQMVRFGDHNRATEKSPTVEVKTVRVLLSVETSINGNLGTLRVMVNKEETTLGCFGGPRLIIESFEDLLIESFESCIRLHQVVSELWCFKRSIEIKGAKGWSGSAGLQGYGEWADPLTGYKEGYLETHPRLLASLLVSRQGARFRVFKEAGETHPSPLSLGGIPCLFLSHSREFGNLVLGSWGCASLVKPILENGAGPTTAWSSQSVGCRPISLLPVSNGRQRYTVVLLGVPLVGKRGFYGSCLSISSGSEETRLFPSHAIPMSILHPRKEKCLVEFGIVTQCMAPKRVNDQYLTNVILKIISNLGVSSFVITVVGFTSEIVGGTAGCVIWVAWFELLNLDWNSVVGRGTDGGGLSKGWRLNESLLKTG